LRIKEQDKHLIIKEHNDDNDDKKIIVGTNKEQHPLDHLDINERIS